MVIEVDAADFPDELINVEAAGQRSGRHGVPGQAPQQPTPFRFHRQQSHPHRLLVFDIIELEEAGGDGTAAPEACRLGPAKPALDNRA